MPKQSSWYQEIDAAKLNIQMGYCKYRHTHAYIHHAPFQTSQTRVPEPTEGVGASSSITACLPAIFLSSGVLVYRSGWWHSWACDSAFRVLGLQVWAPTLGSVYSSQSMHSSFLSYCASPVHPRSLQQQIPNSTWRSYACAYSVRPCMWFSREITRESTDVLWYIKIISNIQVWTVALSDTVWYNHPQIPVIGLLIPGDLTSRECILPGSVCFVK